MSIDHFEESKKMKARVEQANLTQETVIKYAGFFMTMEIIYVLIYFSIITYPVSLRFYIIYVILFCSLCYWMAAWSILYMPEDSPFVYGII